MKKNTSQNKIGGMALLEGVLMRSKEKCATSTRNNNNLIEIEVTNIKTSKSNQVISKIPIIRGILAFFSSLVSGLKAITRSAKLIEIKDEDGENFEITNTEIVIAIIISLVLCLAIFLVLPSIVANLIAPINIIENKLVYNLIESITKLAIFISYLLLISNIKEIKKIFKYHGAEHKTINAYENLKEKLTIANVKEFSRFHVRCGSSFIILVILTSFIISFFISVPDYYLRLLIKFLLLPFIAGLSYELIIYTSKYSNILTKIITFPGILIQKITTKDPEDRQIECAISSLYACLDENSYISLKDLMEQTKSKYANFNLSQNDMLRILSFILDENKEKLFANINETYLEYYQYINFNKYIVDLLILNIPIQYIVQNQSFFGLSFYVNSSVLIPREDTEILVSTAIEEIQNNNYEYLLDLCSGSGNIGISIAKNSLLKEVTFIDISSTALNVCSKNISNLELTTKTIVKKSDLFTDIEKTNKFDIIVSNPPYITKEEMLVLDANVKNEPRLALYGGIDGLDYYKKISKEAKQHLNDNGSLIFEIGATQADDVKNILEDNSYSDIEIIKDLSGKNRVVKCHFHKI